MDRTQFKAVITVAIIIAAGSLGVIFTAIDFSQGNNQSSANGLVIDHGNWNADWYPLENPDNTVKNSLLHLQSKGSITIEWQGDSIVSIDGIKNDDTHKWGLWAIKKGENFYNNLQNDYEVYVKDFSVCTISYTTADGTPVPGTDYFGNPIFGKSNITRTVTMSPSITEIVCSFGAVDTIVGSDSASNYPESFNQRKAEGKITEVADFRSASLEKIISVNPNVAFFDGSATPTLDIAKRINETTSIDAIVLYPGWDVEQIMKNMFIVGTCLGIEYKDATLTELNRIYNAYHQLIDITSKSETKRTGVVIMSDVGTTDWFAGKETCVRDYIVSLNGNYGFDDLVVTWETLNDEKLVQLNPDFIIVISNSYTGLSGYDQFIKNHEDRWQSMKCWKNSIYLLYDQASDITSRLGPRFVECTEIFAKYMYPELFPGKAIPFNYLGNNYRDYLTYTKEVVA